MSEEIHPDRVVECPSPYDFTGRLFAFTAILLLIGHYPVEIFGWPSWIAWAPAIAYLYWSAAHEQKRLFHLAVAWKAKIVKEREGGN